MDEKDLNTCHQEETKEPENWKDLKGRERGELSDPRIQSDFTLTVSLTPVMEPLINLRTIFLIREISFRMPCSLVIDTIMSRNKVFTVLHK